MNENSLIVSNAKKSFGGIGVVKNVSLDIVPGEVIVLLGENGAGKSTLLKMIGGVYEADAIEMQRGGVPLMIRDVVAARAAGIAMVHQELNLVDTQTVWQNVFLGQEPTSGIRAIGLIDRAHARSQAQLLLDQVGAAVSADALVRDIPLAQRQQVEIAKALSQAGVSILLLDEPTSSLTEEQAGDLLGVIRRLKSQGIGVVLTTHRMDEAFSIADRIVVLRDGEKIAEVRADDPNITQASIIEQMVGRALNTLFPDHRAPTDEKIFEVEDLKGGMVEGVSFDVRRGEIFGIGGLVGAGRTETLRRIFGAEKSTSTVMKLNGNPVSIRTPGQAVRAGMGFVPEDRKADGLVLLQSIADNIALPNLGSLGRFAWVRSRLRSKLATRFVEKLGIKTRQTAQQVWQLSGGNQQKVVLAKWLARPLQLLILDEPTRGIDIGARSDIYRLIDEIAASGVAVILVSSDMEELIGLSDRVAVMAGGRIVDILSGDDITQPRILTLASQITAEKQYI